MRAVSLISAKIDLIMKKRFPLKTGLQAPGRFSMFPREATAA